MHVYVGKLAQLPLTLLVTRLRQDVRFACKSLFRHIQWRTQQNPSWTPARTSAAHTQLLRLPGPVKNGLTGTKCTINAIHALHLFLRFTPALQSGSV